MTTRHPVSGGPREPRNIPIRIFSAGRSLAEELEAQALLRDIRALIEDGIRRGVLPYAPRRKTKKARRLKK
jgi:hypothetical protein